MFNGLFGITNLSNSQSRSITAENVYGEKGRGGMAEVSADPQADVVKIGQKWDGAESLRGTWAEAGRCVRASRCPGSRSPR